MTNPGLTFRKVDKTNWADLVRLFNGRGGPKNCWCMLWREKPPGARGGDVETRKAVLKAALRKRVEDGTPIGLLGYDGKKPVAWCSVAPRPSYRSLGGPEAPVEEAAAIWSLACFFVLRAMRGTGVADQLLKAAIAYAKREGAKIVEAYPVDRDSPSYRFMGIVGAFEKAGFERVGRAGSRRHVMRLSIR